MWPKNGRLLGWRAAAAHHLQSQIEKGVLQRIVREYLAPITATGGQSGGFIVNDQRTGCREIRPVGKCTPVCKTASVGGLFHLIPLEPRP